MDHTTDSRLAMTRKERAHFLSFTEPLTRDVHPDAELTTIIGADTFDVVTARLERMLAQRHNVTYLRHHLGRRLEVAPLVVPVPVAKRSGEPERNWYTGRGDFELSWRALYGRRSDAVGEYQIGFCAPAETTATLNAARADAEHTSDGNPRNVARVTIHGGGEGNDELAFGDHVIVERFNEFGVGEWTRIDFHPAPTRS